ncbi:MAG: hypothetical protein NXH87_16875 [Rhodobiaceae bacterium]|nr:hypothetical protein [Rhodobiaceae bacterium]
MFAEIAKTALKWSLYLTLPGAAALLAYIYWAFHVDHEPELGDVECERITSADAEFYNQYLGSFVLLPSMERTRATTPDYLASLLSTTLLPNGAASEDFVRGPIVDLGVMAERAENTYLQGDWVSSFILSYRSLRTLIVSQDIAFEDSDSIDSLLAIHIDSTRKLGCTDWRICALSQNLQGVLAEKRRDYPLAAEHYRDVVSLLPSQYLSERGALVNLNRVLRANGEWAERALVQDRLLRLAESRADHRDVHLRAASAASGLDEVLENLGDRAAFKRIWCAAVRYTNQSINAHERIDRFASVENFFIKAFGYSMVLRTRTSLRRQLIMYQVPLLLLDKEERLK